MGVLDSLDLVTFSTLAIGIATFLFIKANWRRKDYPTGPWALPILGNLLNLQFGEGRVYEKCGRWQSIYGPVLSLKMGMQDYIFINDAEYGKEAFVKKNLALAGRPHTYTGELTTGNKDMTFRPEPDGTWSLSRKVVIGAARKYALSEDMVQRCVAAIKLAKAEIAKEGNKPLDVGKYATLMIFNVICGMCFGKSFEFDDPFFVSFTKLFNEANATINNGLPADMFPFLKYFPSSSVKKILHVMSMYNGFMQKTMEEHQETFDPENVTDLTYHVIEMQKEVEAEGGVSSLKLTEEDMQLIIQNVFFAGTDTSRTALTWMLLFLTDNPDVQKKAWQEVHSVVGDSRPVSPKDRSKLTYIEAVLMETLRRRPIAPLGLPHRATCDTTLGDFKIPKGTGVMVNIYALHHDPKYWKEPQMFRPERFLDDNGKLISRPESYGPFSFGRRNCVGEILAKADLNLLAAMLIQQFQFVKPDGQQLDLEPTQGTLLMIPNSNTKVIVKHRDINF